MHLKGVINLGAEVEVEMTDPPDFGIGQRAASRRRGSTGR